MFLHKYLLRSFSSSGRTRRWVVTTFFTRLNRTVERSRVIWFYYGYSFIKLIYYILWTFESRSRNWYLGSSYASFMVNYVVTKIHKTYTLHNFPIGVGGDHRLTNEITLKHFIKAFTFLDKIIHETVFTLKLLKQWFLSVQKSCNIWSSIKITTRTKVFV